MLSKKKKVSVFPKDFKKLPNKYDFEDLTAQDALSMFRVCWNSLMGKGKGTLWHLLTGLRGVDVDGYDRLKMLITTRIRAMMFGKDEAEEVAHERGAFTIRHTGAYARWEPLNREEILEVRKMLSHFPKVEHFVHHARTAVRILGNILGDNVVEDVVLALHPQMSLPIRMREQDEEREEAK